MEFIDYLQEIDKIYEKWCVDVKADKARANGAYILSIDNLSSRAALSSIPNRLFCLHLTGDTESAYAEFAYQKKYWLVFSGTLIKRGYAKIKDVLEILLTWFKDFNWSGAVELYNYLVKSHDDDIIVALDNAKKQARAENDIDWLNGLIMFERAIEGQPQ
jgi:hypothetical protein